MDIEIVLNDDSSTEVLALEQFIQSFLKGFTLPVENIIPCLFNFDNIRINVERIRIGQLENNFDLTKIKKASDIKIFVYKLTESGFANGDDIAEGETDSVPPTIERILPSRDFDGLWENLIFEKDIKSQLMSYAHTILRLGHNGIDPQIINCGRLILLHGPPGTGKTSLCQALGQKISIQFKSVYKSTFYIEINSHSLFSKWFSESGKMVMKLFKQILDIVQMPSTLVCVLIDEVESLTLSRQNLSQDPSDSIRAVNAMLTQLDLLRHYGNVLILTTSNIPDKIDNAFRDRADLKIYIGPPGEAAIYSILLSCIEELKRVGILRNDEFTKDEILLLKQISRLCIGLSGRTLRKLPLMALSIHLPRSEEKFSINEYLLALKESALYHSLSENKI